MNLSPHFTLEEFIVSTTASQCGINNWPTLEVAVELRRLALVLEKARTILGDAPIVITSGYRCLELNAAVGGAADSAHLYGRAADFIVADYGSAEEICKTLEPHVQELGIDQLILEYGDWVHLGLVGKGEIPRCQCLTIDNSGTSEGFA